MPISLRTAELSEDEVDMLEPVAIRSTSWLGRPGGVLMKRSGDASRSFLSTSRSTIFILAIDIDRGTIARKNKVMWRN
jgi:hypothetical protein